MHGLEFRGRPRHHSQVMIRHRLEIRVSKDLQLGQATEAQVLVHQRLMVDLVARRPELRLHQVDSSQLQRCQLALTE